MPYANSQDTMNQLRNDLLIARKARDSFTVSTLQSVVAAVDNAGAVAAPNNLDTTGVGSTEALRRELSAEDVQKIVVDEIAELQETIKELNGSADVYADELRSKIMILQKYTR